MYGPHFPPLHIHLERTDLANSPSFETKVSSSLGHLENMPKRDGKSATNFPREHRPAKWALVIFSFRGLENKYPWIWGPYSLFHDGSTTPSAVGLSDSCIFCLWLHIFFTVCLLCRAVRFDGRSCPPSHVQWIPSTWHVTKCIARTLHVAYFLIIMSWWLLMMKGMWCLSVDWRTSS